VVGRFDIDMVGDVRVGSPASDAANRVRRTLRDVADDAMGPEEAALFSGLVIGDDARQSPEMVQRFRDVGLSHLTAVSGQNVAFVLAAAAPLLHRLSARRRWGVSLGLIVWFMVLTRFEPSVLRAGVMAMLSATAFLVGRAASPTRLLAITVTVLTVIDPLLVWSVGFWLSVSATAGVAVVAPRLEQLLRLPSWCATALGVTLGAQIGVAVPSLLVFGRLPIVALLANPTAVPVAGFVMLVGVPSAMSAALLSASGLSFAADAVMLPSRLGTRWVDQVSRVAAVVEPPPVVSSACWMVLGVALVGLWWRNRVARQTDVPI
jgi:competence protein ComEC